MTALQPGTEAFVTLNQTSGKASRSGPRARLVGAARVRVDARHGDEYTVTVLAGSGAEPGSVRRFSRAELFATAEERAYFGQLVSFFWDGVPMTMERPQ